MKLAPALLLLATAAVAQTPTPVPLTPEGIRVIALKQPDGSRCDKANWPRTDIYCRALEEVAGQYFLRQAKPLPTSKPETNLPPQPVPQGGK